MVKQKVEGRSASVHHQIDLTETICRHMCTQGCCRVKTCEPQNVPSSRRDWPQSSGSHLMQEKGSISCIRYGRLEPISHGRGAGRVRVSSRPFWLTNQRESLEGDKLLSA